MHSEPSVSDLRDVEMMPPPGETLVGQSGRRYLTERVLQDKGPSLGRVRLATEGSHKFVLKDIPTSEFDYYRGMYRNIHGSHHIRQLHDTIPGHSIFVFEYIADHLLNVAQKNLPVHVVKKILLDALRGIAILHDQNIVHTDIKANNILVETVEDQHGIDVKQTKLTDIESAAYVPPKCAIVGSQVGNWMWRSPEAHAQGRVNKPSDMFSFGIVCIYAVLKRVIFAVDEEELREGEDVLSVVLTRQMSYFADLDGLHGLLKHLGNSPWCEVFHILAGGFGAENPRKPFAHWAKLDVDFKDLVVGLTKFDPSQRLTARDALAHPWFRDVCAIHEGLIV
ncbi:MAG: hypothetical protein Q9208_001534 [Pyrenodesmia sp. 3 TL-2023]